MSKKIKMWKVYDNDGDDDDNDDVRSTAHNFSSFQVSQIQHCIFLSHYKVQSYYHWDFYHRCNGTQIKEQFHGNLDIEEWTAL